MSSPNFTLSKSTLSLSGYQIIDGFKDVASGYAGLNESNLIDPAKFLPGYDGAAAGSFWVKSGTTLVARPGSTFTDDALTVGSVSLGLTGGTIYGIKQTEANRVLALVAGSSKAEVWIGSSQSLKGGTDASYGTATWTILSSGACAFTGATFAGTVAMAANSITSTGTIGSAALSLNCGAGTITSNTTLALNAGGVVTVPDAANDDNGTLKAVNFGRANAYYGRKNTINTWAEIQTFSKKPVFGVLLSIDQITSLANTLAAKLPLTAGTSFPLSGDLYMGLHQIKNLDHPAGDGDATRKKYVDDLTIQSTGGILTDMKAELPLIKDMGGDTTTIRIQKVTALLDGYLSKEDFFAFSNSTSKITTPLSQPGKFLAGPAVVSGSAVAPDLRTIAASDLSYINYSITHPISTFTSPSTYTPLSCTANAVIETANIPLSQATFGDFVSVSFSAIPIPTGLLISAYVFSAGQVRIRFQNITSSIILLGASSIISMKIGITKFPQ